MLLITHEGKKSTSNISIEAVSLGQLRSFLTLVELRHWISHRLKSKSYVWNVMIYENTDTISDRNHIAQGYEQLIKIIESIINDLESK